MKEKAPDESVKQKQQNPKVPEHFFHSTPAQSRVNESKSPQIGQGPVNLPLVASMRKLL
jgi:hypothetical protein